MLALIDREAGNTLRKGEEAHIIAKMNALLDKTVVQALYRASQAGVKIDLIVRGICVPSGPQCAASATTSGFAASWAVCSNTVAFSILRNGGEEEIYMGSADWMPRNLYERVEVLVPLRDEMLRERVRREILDAYLADNLEGSSPPERRYLHPSVATHSRHAQPPPPDRSRGIQRAGFSHQYCGGQVDRGPSRTSFFAKA